MQMIPKKIHYCWLSGEEVPLQLQECMNSWRKVMPDYEIICWDKNKFEIESVPFVAEAFKVKKWAFASDYLRLHALYTEGGIYLDSDVIIQKSLNAFLDYDFFTAVEYHKEIVTKENSLSRIDDDGSIKDFFKKSGVPGIGLQAAIIGSVKNHPFLKTCLDFYEKKHFILPDGKFFNEIIAPTILANIAENFGFKYKDVRQELGHKMIILPSDVFAGDISCVTDNSYAIHLCNGSWRTKPTKKQIIQNKCIKLLKSLIRLLK